MPITADSNGTVQTSFTIPAGVRVGTREFRIQGAGGSWGTAKYFGAGVIAHSVLQQVYVTAVNRYDPLAQTFTLPISRMVGGVDIWFTAKGGDTDVRIQIRETQVGMPTQDVLAEAIIPHASITLNAWTRAVFTVPFALQQDREYAIVVMTDDAHHAVAVAELGTQCQRDDGSWLWMTQQAYTVGVLLSSSNASTWTPHQNRDLMFRLLGCRFSATTRTVDFGNVTAAGATDFIVNATVQRTAEDTNVIFGLTPASSGVESQLTEEGSAPLSTPVSGPVAVKAYLSGSALFSPILWGDWTVLLGNLATTSNYVSRAIKAALSFTATVVFEALLPGSATVTPSMEKQNLASGVDQVDGDGNPVTSYVAMTLQSSTEIGDGWVERRFTLTGLRGVGPDRYTRCALVLAGSAGARPQVRNLRVIVK